MFEIRGTYTTAVCYAEICEPEAVSQIQRMCSCAFAEGSKVRIMPDVHAGKGCTVGTTMTVTDRAVPNIVGVDIGCGMYCVRLNGTDPDLPAVDRAAHLVPSGFNVWEKIREPFDLSDLRCFSVLKDHDRLARSLGTLGGGNHFIELERSEDGTHYLVVHSGSRNLGKQTAEYYQDLAVQLHKGKAVLQEEQKKLIEEYKAEGRESELPEALNRLRKDFRESQVPDDLCWLYGQPFEDYLHDIRICQDFAKRNREVIAETILKEAGLSAAEAFHTIHNYIDTDEMILRKGAIAAHENEIVLIPVNMKDGSILARGKGNPDWNNSAPHGAGRLMSRSAAKQTLSMQEYRDAMAGIYTTSISTGTLDEAPMAYKPIESILSSLHETVDVIEILKPVYNFKAQ